MRNREIPEDLLPEILSRLPVKCLLRFKCVCKSWYALITNPNFITKHLTWATSHKTQRGAILNCWDSMGYPRVSTLSNETLELSGDVDLEQLFQLRVGGLTVIGPCNGILCLSGCPSLTYGEREFDDYELLVLWNPATRESKIPSPIHRQLDMPDLTSTFGFGFDPNTNDYKVVRILNFDSQCEVLVYSLSADSWRMIDSSPKPSYFIRSTFFPSYLNGFHHWWGYERKDNMKHQFLISFDMGNEVFQQLPLPPTEEYSCGGQIAVINESVALIRELEGGRYEKWVLDDSGVERSWTKKLTMVLPRLWHLTQLRGDGLVVLSDSDRCLVMYDPRTQQLWDLQLYDAGFLQLFSYTESLVSLNG
jgi:F-box interacting protein